MLVSIPSDLTVYAGQCMLVSIPSMQTSMLRMLLEVMSMLPPICSMLASKPGQDG